MKLKLLTLALLSAFTNTHFAQNSPEKVHSVVKVYKEFDWYVTQNALWEKEVKKSKKMPEAWVNYYASARMAKITTKEDSIRTIWQDKMVEIMQKMEKAIPNTYEYYYLKSWDTFIWTAKDESEEKTIAGYALKAYEMDPTRAEVYPDLINYYAVHDNKEKLKEIANRWSKSNDISSNILKLNYNMLISTEENSILLTCGDNDTYPSLVLQHAKGIRTDVTVINIYLASFSPSYRNNIFKTLGIPALEGKNIDHNIIIEHIIEHKKEHPLSFAFGSYFQKIPTLENKLYNVGMALHYSEDNFNNTSILINNFENKFLIDHLTFDFNKAQFPEQVKRHNLSYIPGLMFLYDHYCLVENEKRKIETKQLIIKLAMNTVYEEDILNHFN